MKHYVNFIVLPFSAIQLPIRHKAPDRPCWRVNKRQGNWAELTFAETSGTVITSDGENIGQ